MRYIERCAGALMLIMAASCASVAPEVAAVPQSWESIDCASCDRVGVTIETRRAVDNAGRPGRYLLARVSNRNAHGVIFDLNLTTNRSVSGDPDFLSKGWRVALGRAGETSAATMLTMELADVTTASVTGVERY